MKRFSSFSKLHCSSSGHSLSNDLQPSRFKYFKDFNSASPSISRKLGTFTTRSLNFCSFDKEAILCKEHVSSSTNIKPSNSSKVPSPSNSSSSLVIFTFKRCKSINNRNFGRDRIMGPTSSFGQFLMTRDCKEGTTCSSLHGSNSIRSGQSPIVNPCSLQVDELKRSLSPLIRLKPFTSSIIRLSNDLNPCTPSKSPSRFWKTKDTSARVVKFSRFSMLGSHVGSPLNVIIRDVSDDGSK
ncbi:hypothetical protein LINGRAPRIM_LOCUS1897 [Linum grandiflorum]